MGVKIDQGSSLWPEVCGIKTAIVQVAMHLQHGHKARMSGPPAQHGLQAARKNIMKHTFKIIYETDGMPICPDAIHKQLDLAMDDIKKQFSIQYYTLPGLHQLYLEPCGDWFPEEQKPIRFKLQAASSKP